MMIKALSLNSWGEAFRATMLRWGDGLSKLVDERGEEALRVVEDGRRAMIEKNDAHEFPKLLSFEEQTLKEQSSMATRFGRAKIALKRLATPSALLAVGAGLALCGLCNYYAAMVPNTFTAKFLDFGAIVSGFSVVFGGLYFFYETRSDLRNLNNARIMMLYVGRRPRAEIPGLLPARCVR